MYGSAHYRFQNILFTQKFPSKVRVTTRFVAESPDFIGYKTGELITLIAKDRHK